MIMNIEEIRRYMPHAYPMLLLDRVLDYETGEYLVALKNVTANEPQFPGHFPNRYVFPGVLTCESMFQAGALLGVKTLEDRGRIEIVEGELPGYTLLTNIDNVRFRRPVLPGDQMIVRAQLTQFRERGEMILGMMDVSAKVEDKICVTGSFRAVLAAP